MKFVFRDRCRGASIVASLVLVCCFAAGQENPPSEKGSIHGTVTDATQAVVTGADVALSGAAGKQQTKTDDKGNYAFSELMPGFYTITISAPTPTRWQALLGK